MVFKIRRAMGATASSVVRLLSNEFIRLILLANLIAGLSTLLLSFLITSYRALLATSRNPADTLRHE